MPPFGFGRKEQPQSFTPDITDKEDLEEIREIAEMLNPNEEVFVVARQSQFKPGGSKFTPNVVFGTDRRITIKDPSILVVRIVININLISSLILLLLLLFKRF